MKGFPLKALLLVLTFLFFASPVLAQTFAADPVHSYVLARARHLDVSYSFARFNELMATLNYDATNPSNNSIVFNVLAESIDTGIARPDTEFDAERRNGHLRSPDFFDVAQFPTIDFTSTIVSATDQENMFEVTGDLTLHGVTNQITIMVEKTGEGVNQGGKKLIGFYTEFTINRSDYGMTDIGSIGDEIMLMVSFEGIEQ